MRNIEDGVEGMTVANGEVDDPQAYLNADQRGGTGPNGKPSLTIDQAGLHLVGGEPGWSSALGVAYTVSYAFRSTAPSEMPSDTGEFSRFNAAQIAQAELALLAWSDEANITFVRVGSGTSGEGAYSNSASILMANYATGEAGAAAFGNYPGDPTFSSESGDVWVNSTFGYNRAPAQGNYGGLVLVHELGHAIGLSHPGNYNAEDGVDITYAHDAEYYEDSLQYTVMSYFDEAETGADYHGAYAASPMLDDISAAQKEYGVNTTTRTGDTVYGFNSTADRPWFLASSLTSELIFAAWDAGGDDTFDFSGFHNAQTIDLREGNFSSVGGLVGNVAVAKGAAIENAIGGSGVDTIIGNALSNHLHGGNGADSLSGLDGADILDGGADIDTLIGGLGDDTYVLDTTIDVILETASAGWDAVYVAASYTLGANLEALTLQGAAANGYGNDLANALYGNASGNYLNGGGGDDYLSAGGGADILDGGTGGDILDGGSGDDSYGVDSVFDSIREAVNG
ncbi:MAG TPA: M10 family metallopeptidase C-terminal domain-containing protein, partial [Caulobacter sp.]|nr:M10 family metallopeptidase C-terminal domain-containing protein [Caulobacter sp.]